jgi:hypothetical protein
MFESGAGCLCQRLFGSFRSGKDGKDGVDARDFEEGHNSIRRARQGKSLPVL